jgi:hypothetical protein
MAARRRTYIDGSERQCGSGRGKRESIRFSRLNQSEVSIDATNVCYRSDSEYATKAHATAQRPSFL